MSKNAAEQLQELNDALLWLSECQGAIGFMTSQKDAEVERYPEAPVVEVEASSMSFQEWLAMPEPKPPNMKACATEEISRGNLVGALLKAINRTREQLACGRREDLDGD